MPHSRNYEALYKLARALHQLDKGLVMERVLNAIASMLDLKRGCLMLLRDDNTIDAITPLEMNSRYPSIPYSAWETLLARGLIGFVLHSQRTIVLRNVATDARWINLPELPHSGSAVGIPLRQTESILGVMLFMHPLADYFDAERVSLLEEIADLAAVALKNALAFQAVDAAATKSEPLGNHPTEESPKADSPLSKDSSRGEPIEGGESQTVQLA
ncbi:MAG: GAF domain-containing protein [Chitinophagaceae bacterium]|nr:GAF domain-containing protein [Anaerolineae bacterium]